MNHIVHLNVKRRGRTVHLGSIALPGNYSFSEADFMAQKNLCNLQEAIRTNNMRKIYQIVHSDPTVINRQLIGTKRFPILLAIQYKNEKALAFLLRKKPNLLLSSRNGETVSSALFQVDNEKLRQKLKAAYTMQLEHARAVGRHL